MAAEYKYEADWYRLSYTRAAVTLNRAVSDAAQPGDAQNARSEARTILLAAYEVGEKAPEPLKRFLATAIEPSTMVLLAGALIAPERPRPTLSPEMKRAMRRLRGGVEESPEPPAPPPDRTSLFKRLRDEKAPDPEASEWVAYVASLRIIPYRTRYNLACLHTQLRREGEAAQDLRTALAQAPGPERRRLAQQALDDPSLKPLFEQRHLWHEIEAIARGEHERHAPRSGG